MIEKKNIKKGQSGFILVIHLEIKWERKIDNSFLMII